MKELINLRIEKELLEKTKKIAKENEVTVTSIIENCLKDNLKAYEVYLKKITEINKLREKELEEAKKEYEGELKNDITRIFK